MTLALCPCGHCSTLTAVQGQSFCLVMFVVLHQCSTEFKGSLCNMGKVVSFGQTMHSGNSTQDEFQFSISGILFFIRHNRHSILFK